MLTEHKPPVCGLAEQEIFNRAWNGLKSQGWKKARRGVVSVYYTHDGLRCAWGWADPEATQKMSLNFNCLPISTLRFFKVGLAAKLTPDQYAFAEDLQKTHDRAMNGDELQRFMRRLASDYGLEVPE